jgi:putative ABC transport system substrate-binding protein
MRRGLPLALVAICAASLSLALPLGVEAQVRTYKVGLVSRPPSGAGVKLFADGVDTFRQECQRLGYLEGQNLALQVRLDGETGVRELLKSNIDVLVALWSPMALAAKRATTSVPIVAIGPRDPVEQGLIKSFPRPGGNVTGVSSTVGEERGGVPLKRLEILKEMVPRVSRVAYLTDLAFPGTAPFVPVVERAASRMGLAIQTFDVRSDSDIDKAFLEMVRGGVDGILVAAEVNKSRIITLAAKHRIPAVYVLRQNAEEGGLVAFDVDRRELFRRAAYFVDRILKGAKPADLPFEQPTRFELVINLKTAKALGLTIPPSILLRATQVIE